MPKTICLILPSISSGGQERVMLELAAYFTKFPSLKVYIISLTKGKKFYSIPGKTYFFEPNFYHKKYPRLVFTIKTFFYLRKVLKNLRPDVLLSFGGKYNAFVLMASLGLNIRAFISERSRPTISYGLILDVINPLVYKMAYGIIAQTEKAKEVLYRKTGHPNIKVIGNPIRNIGNEKLTRENIILNVGRFIPSKNQELLVEYFAKINPKNWRLIFIGDGPLLRKVEQKAKSLKIDGKVEFLGFISKVDQFYMKSKIFAFTSTSEGFPNALGEAMSAGMACISFDCEAGPSELIDDGINGFLIKELDHYNYIRKLNLLIENENLLKNFGEKAKKKMVDFRIEKIGEEYYNFLFNN